MAYQTLMQEYMQMPVVTRAYTTACVVTTLAVQLEIVSPFQLYFNPILIMKQYQVWRLVTTFTFFGTFGFNFFFNMIFTYRYCRMLEEGSFRGRTADFVMMFLFGGVCMTTCAFLGANLLFLGQAFTIMLVYVWARRNPFIRMNFFGLMNFQAPYLPWVLLGFSVLLGNTVWVDLIGMAVGHSYYFLEDVFPHQRNGFRILKTPQFFVHWKWFTNWYSAHARPTPISSRQKQKRQAKNCSDRTSDPQLRSNQFEGTANGPAWILYTVRKSLQTPKPIISVRKNIFDPPVEDPNYSALPEERPGGFDWGGRDQAPAPAPQ